MVRERVISYTFLMFWKAVLRQCLVFWMNILFSQEKMVSSHQRKMAVCTSEKTNFVKSFRFSRKDLKKNTHTWYHFHMYWIHTDSRLTKVWYFQWKHLLFLICLKPLLLPTPVAVDTVNIPILQMSKPPFTMVHNLIWPKSPYGRSIAKLGFYTRPVRFQSPRSPKWGEALGNSASLEAGQSDRRYEGWRGTDLVPQLTSQVHPSGSEPRPRCFKEFLSGLNYITEKQWPIHRKCFVKSDCFLNDDDWSFTYPVTSDAQTWALL